MKAGRIAVSISVSLKGGHSESRPQGTRSPPSIAASGPPGSEPHPAHGCAPGASVQA